MVYILSGRIAIVEPLPILAVTMAWRLCRACYLAKMVVRLQGSKRTTILFQNLPGERSMPHFATDQPRGLSEEGYV